jgi:hypothetical protein
MRITRRLEELLLRVGVRRSRVELSGAVRISHGGHGGTVNCRRIGISHRRWRRRDFRPASAAQFIWRARICGGSGRGRTGWTGRSVVLGITGWFEW